MASFLERQLAAMDLGFEDPKRAVPEFLNLLEEAKTAEDNGTQRSILSSLVYLHLTLGDLTSARACAEERVRISVEDIDRAGAFAELGDVCIRLGDADAAKRAFQQVLDVGLTSLVHGMVADDMNRVATRRLAELGKR